MCELISCIYQQCKNSILQYLQQNILACNISHPYVTIEMVSTAVRDGKCKCSLFQLPWFLQRHNYHAIKLVTSLALSSSSTYFWSASSFCWIRVCNKTTYIFLWNIIACKQLSKSKNVSCKDFQKWFLSTLPQPYL